VSCLDEALCAIFSTGKNGQNQAFGLFVNKSYGNGVLNATTGHY
jgi:hypothetical protein